MAGIFDKLIDFMNLSDEDGEETDGYEYESDEDELYDTSDEGVNRIDDYSDRRQFKSYEGGRAYQSKVSNIQASFQMEVSVISPQGFDDAKEICNYLKQYKPVIINLETIEHAEAQRIMDFISGSCYTLEGTVQKLSNQIFIIAPANVDITGNDNLDEKLKNNGIILPWKGE